MHPSVKQMSLKSEISFLIIFFGTCSAGGLSRAWAVDMAPVLNLDKANCYSTQYFENKVLFIDINLNGRTIFNIVPSKL